MKPDHGQPETSRGERGPWLVYVILALIVGLLTAFLVLRPRGPQASAPRSSLESPSISGAASAA